MWAASVVYVPIRFVVFALVGSSGVLAHLLVMWILFPVLGVPFAWAQAIATLIAMSANFLSVCPMSCCII